MNEVKVLAAAARDRDHYHRVVRVLDNEDLSPVAQTVVKHMEDYYARDADVKSVDLEVLQGFCERDLPRHTDQVRAVIERMAHEEVSTNNVVQDLLEVKKRSLQLRIAEKLSQNDPIADDLMDEYNHLKQSGDVDNINGAKIIVPTTVQAAVDHFSHDNLVPVYPKALNDAIGGGAPFGSHLLVFAPPEVGKTLMSVNLACGAAYAGRRVLYVGNEDPEELILLRMYSRMTGMPRNDLMQNREEADRKAEEMGIRNITLASLAPGTVSDVTSLYRRFEPEIIILDQLTNFYAPGGTRVEQFDWLAKRARRLAKQTGAVVVSLCQGADTAIGKSVLEMGDVYYSNVAVQAQVDVMIGMGMTDEDQRTGRRMLSLCKNKLNGNHEPVPVTVNEHTSKVVGAGE